MMFVKRRGTEVNASSAPTTNGVTANINTNKKRNGSFNSLSSYTS
jgi:hypothetical protein